MNETELNLNAIDLVVRFVPRYGYLPLVIGHDRVTARTHEYFRGEFKRTPEDALESASEALQRTRKWSPPVEEFLVRAKGA